MEAESWTDTLLECERLVAEYYHTLENSMFQANVTNINGQQAVILLRMDELRPQPLHSVIQTCYVGSNITYNLQRLEAAGYIQRLRSCDDHRAKMVAMTQDGRNIRRKIEEIMRTNVRTVDSVQI